jgi:hypothetical protein
MRMRVLPTGWLPQAQTYIGRSAETKAKKLSILDKVRTRFSHRSLSVDNEVWSFTETKEEGFPLVLLPGAPGTGEVYFNQMTWPGHQGHRRHLSGG